MTVTLPLLALLLVQDSLTFEVASIRPSNHEANSSGFTTTASGLKTENTSLLALILFAYRARPFQIIGATNWMEDLRWNITARNPDGETGTPAESGKRNLARMRALLADRFQLKIKEETRELPVYGLVIDKAGLKIKKTEKGGSTTSRQNGGSGSLVSTGLSMKDLAMSLSGMVGRTIIDETGLDDTMYEIDLKWTDNASGDGPSIFTAVREQLGLRFESKKGPVPVYVIERAEKPSEN